MGCDFKLDNNESQIMNKTQKPITQTTINKEVDFKLSDENCRLFVDIPNTRVVNYLVCLLFEKRGRYF